MSNEQAPECCPFCGAGMQQSTPDNEDIQYRCGSWINHGGPNSTVPPMKPIRTTPCFEAERERLTRERDQALMMLGVYKMDKDDLLARVKRLEEAGDAIVDHNIGCGCGHDGPCRACRMACEAWTKAKEAKP